MFTCIDVFYAGAQATSACVLFDDWRAETPARTFVHRRSGVEPYESGHFFRRELPCLVGVLAELSERPSLVIIDGYVWLGPAEQPGLGAHLFEALGRTTPVIGVAKTPFPGAPAVEVVRGQSRTPLHVTAAGFDVERAADHIRSMSGAHRLPTMLRLADQLSRQG